jgi:hypothetical protein
MATGSGNDEYDFTSNAPGLAAGAAALVLSVHPDWTPAQVSEALIGHAIPNLIPNAGDSPNRLLYVGP